MKTTQTLLSLQALRGIAVICVVLVHLKFPIEEIFKPILLPPLLHFNGLACGVDIFFVLSGFVISMTAERQNAGPGVFMKQRLIRVLPLYWIISAPLLISYIYKSISEKHFNIRFIRDNILLFPLWDKFAVAYPLLIVGWSLYFEMWFYVLFAILLIFISAKNVPFSIAGILLVFSSVAFLWNGTWHFPAFAFHPFCWEFAMGCIAYEISKSWSPSNLLPLYSMLALGLLLLIYTASHYESLGEAWITRESPSRSAIRSIIWGIPSFLIVLSSILFEKRGVSMHILSPLVYLGNASYAIYLIHLPAYSCIERYGPYIFKAGMIYSSLIFLVASIIAGVILHHFVEKPLTLFLRHRFISHSPKPVL